MLSRITRSVFTSNVSTLLKQREIESMSVVTSRAIRTSEYRRDDINKPPSSIMVRTFAEVKEKEKETYLDILREYKKNNELRRGHVEFIQTALKYMDDFGVNRDLAVYKALLDVLPKGKFIPVNFLQTVYVHYPKQQYVALYLLSKMEHNCVMPDVEMQEMLLNIFGKQGLPLKKFWRMMYWMPKFANLNPWPCPRPAPRDPQVLAKLAMSKVASIDVQTEITLFKTKDVKDSIDDTWIVSAMSSTQEELLQTQSPDNPIFIEGPYTIWVADRCIDYFVLRGESRRKDNNTEQNIDDVSNITIPFWDKREVAPVCTIHEQNDGTYFAMCATGTSTKDSLLSWIRCLQVKNPTLNVIPVVFKLTSLTKEQLYIENSGGENDITQREENS